MPCNDPGGSNKPFPFVDSMDYLKEYESERQKHNVPTMLAVEALHRLYNTEFTPIVLLRSLGLQTTHALDPIKVKRLSKPLVNA